jgi:catechol 2,3-dioxygenase-like lactoylglutathione lyase family enzyme
MIFQSLSPVLVTKSMERSVGFYVGVLGFTCGTQTPDYSNLYRDRVRLILASPNAHEDWAGPKFPGHLYIHLDAPEQIDTLWSVIQNRNDLPPD